MMKSLEGRVAVVAGATRGAGRGIACMLGEAGAVVYCTGRSTREQPNMTGAFAGRPENIDETAEMVSARGGRGIPARTDHSDESQVEAAVWSLAPWLLSTGRRSRPAAISGRRACVSLSRSCSRRSAGPCWSGSSCPS